MTSERLREAAQHCAQVSAADSQALEHLATAVALVIEHLFEQDMARQTVVHGPECTYAGRCECAGKGHPL